MARFAKLHRSGVEFRYKFHSRTENVVIGLGQFTPLFPTLKRLVRVSRAEIQKSGQVRWSGTSASTYLRSSVNGMLIA